MDDVERFFAILELESEIDEAKQSLAETSRALAWLWVSMRQVPVHYRRN